MRRTYWLGVLGGLLPLGILTTNQAAEGGEAGAGRARERHPDRKDLENDERDLRKDRRDIREDEQDIRGDRKDLRKDRKDGEDTSEDQKDLKGDRQDLRRDRKDAEKDRRDLRNDTRDLRSDSEAGSKAREKEVDARQANQARRIEHGIKNGSLTPDEVSKLEAQQKSIADMEAKFEGDGKLSRSECKQLNQELNTASRCIFAEKHDTEGNQMSVYRLGKNVKLNSDVAQKLEDPNLSKADARAFTHDFHHLMELKHALGTKELSDARRAEMQKQYNDLLNKYFTLS